MKIDGLSAVVFKSVFLTIILLVMISVSLAQVRNSSNYQIQSDSINFGGGLSTSTNYSLESTAGEIGSGESSSNNYELRAGYQQMQSVYISMTAVSPVVMSANLGGITGGVANGTTSVAVFTDSPSGYQLTISAENSPAMQKGGDTIADYVPIADPLPDMSFSLNVNDVHFGFSPSGSDVTQRWLNDTSDCGVGTNSTPLVCWDGLSTSEKVIAQGLANHPTGATTTLRFKLGIGGGVAVPAGDYYATTTLTALPL
jgi:hypothetical protein